MKIVFITNSYYPYFSAIGKCINNLVEELKGCHEVIVITNMTTINLQNEEVYNGHKIIRVRTRKMKKRDKISSQKSGINISRKIINIICMFLIRSGEYLKTISSLKSLQKPLVEEFVEALSNIKDIDIVIPTCYPFESIIAAKYYKEHINKDVKIIPFLFDKYSDSPTLHRNKINKLLKYRKHLSIEKNMINISEKIFYVDSWINHMEKYFSEYHEKLVHVEHPLIVDSYNGISIQKNSNRSKYINIVYTGVLDKKVRPPLNTLKIISKIIEKDGRFRFHFYVLGNCNKVLNNFQNKYPNNIFNHGQVKTAEALYETIKSNILLSIGNTDISLIPSKIFEYMSCGKPIIHFYNSADDRVIDILEKYGLGYCEKQESELSEENISNIMEFCYTKCDTTKSFDEVKKIFYLATPEYISEKLIERSF